MGIRFEEPLALLLFIALPLYIIWIWRHTLRLQKTRKLAVIGTRWLLMILLISALAGLQFYSSVERLSTIYVIDRSDSVSNQAPLLQWMKDSAKSKKPQDSLGVVSFGLDAAIDRKTDIKDLSSFSFTSLVNKQFTNIAAGLQLVAGITSQDASIRAVLLSDGQENVGELLRQGRLLKDRGVPVDILQIPHAVKRDVAVEGVKLPEKLFQGEKYSLEIQLASTEATSGELRVYEDNNEISHQQVQLEIGTNRFVIQSIAIDSGFHRYRAEIYVQGDTQAANDAGYAFSRVTGSPKVLVVEGELGSSKNITSVLNSSFLAYEVIQPEQLPKELADYTGYEAIVLNNVPATRMSQNQMLMIEQSVHDYGIGLTMLGGDNSFGLGGYFQTPVEKALPVYMDLRGKREIPSLGLMLVIDKSGSMSGEKIRLAQDAATRTIDLMREKDTIGILAFDSSPWWVVKPQKLVDKKSVIADVNSIQADGGTEIYNSVNEAYQQLLKVDTQRKHIILLTDGQSATNQSYEALMADMVHNNITLSSVAIGDDADQPLLARIAELAKGRFYYAHDQSTVPAIFSREAVMISRTYIVDQPFIPTFGQGSDWFPLFSQGIPRINAYIATTPKETAEVSLMSPEPDPLLARWQYGSGRSVAWTSDVTGKWSGDWAAWRDFPKVFNQIIKWTFPQFNSSPLELTSHLSGNEALLNVQSTDPNFKGDLRATITDDTLQKQSITFTPAAPGQYSAKLPVQKPGVYITQIEALSSGSQEVIGSSTSGFVIPYAPEYRIAETSNNTKLQQLAELTGGRVLSFEHPEQLFKVKPKPIRHSYDAREALLIASLFIWLLDIALRRLSLPWERIPQWLALQISNQRHRSAKSASTASQSVFSRLNTRRTGAAKLQPRETALMNFDKEPFKDSELITATSDPTPKQADSPELQNRNDTMNRLLAAKNRKIK